MTAQRGPLPVICLGGPTGCGKTDMAIRLALELNCEIINADSRQVYADFPLITAQPSPREREAVPHHLYGFLPSHRKISAGAWIAMARAKAGEILNRGAIPLLVGGTGLYFQSLLRGIAAIPPVDPAITRALEKRMAELGPQKLRAELALADPEYAAKVHSNDRQRILRALEVFAGTGKAFSWWHAHAMSPPLCAGPLFVVNAGLDWLEPRLGARIKNMLEAGALDEARKAIANCADERAPGWTGIGCAEIRAFLEGRLNLAQCERLWLASTRAYAKRQLTWFRGRDEAIFTAPGDLAAILEHCRGLAWRTWANQD